MEVDLHGCRVHEVAAIVRRTLDSALLQGVNASFVHGYRGGNALSRELGRVLREIRDNGEYPIKEWCRNPANPGETLVVF